MGGGDLNLKKSWHPSTLRNIERVWKAEQKHEAEQQKIEQLQKELAAERAREEIQAYAEDKGVVKKRDERLDWMYQGPASLVSRDDYLMGRKIDKTFEIMEMHENGQNESSANTEGPASLFRPGSSTSDVTVDLATKIREDPLFAIMKREKDQRKTLLNNPVKMKQLKKMLEKSIGDDKKVKQKKSKKSKRKYSSSSASSTSSSEDEQPVLKKNKKLVKGNEQAIRHEQRSIRYNENSPSYDERSTTNDKRSTKYDERSDRYDEKLNRYDEKSTRYDERSNRYAEKSDRYDERSDRYDERLSKHDKRPAGHHERSARQEKKFTRNDERSTKYMERSTKYDENSPRLEIKSSRSDKKSSSYKSGETDQSSNHYSHDVAFSKSKHGENSYDFEDKKHNKYDRRSYSSKERNDKTIEKSSYSKEYAGQKYDGQSFKSKQRQEPQKKLSAADKEKLRQEMMDNAKWRENQRKQNVERYIKEGELEDNIGNGSASDFIKPMLSKAAEYGSVEGRVKQKIFTIQRRRGDMDKNFAKR